MLSSRSFLAWLVTHINCIRSLDGVFHVVEVVLGVDDIGNFLNLEGWGTFTIGLQDPSTFLLEGHGGDFNFSCLECVNSWGCDQSSATAGVLSLPAARQPELGPWISVTSGIIWIYRSRSC